MTMTESEMRHPEPADPMAYRERAEAGDAEAQYRLGLSYQTRDSVGRARRWLQRAADGGHGDAALELGLMHLEGRGVAASPRDAVAWFQKGAEASSTAAMCRLASLCFTGFGTAVDEPEAKRWLLASARAGHPAALRQLGFVYARLLPRESWEPRAFACLRRAAELGDAFAMHACGVRLREARGTEADEAAAERWLGGAAARDVYVSRQQVPPAPEDLPAAAGEDPEIVDFDWPAPREAKLERLTEDPPVHRIHDLVDPEMCDYLINVAAPHLEPARTVDPRTGKAVHNRIRTNSHAGIHGGMLDIPIHLVEKDLTHVARAEVSRAERLALLRYGVGEEYRPHFDYINPHAADFQREYRDRGQRVKTVFAYLNDVPVGGETDFPRLGVKVKPERGGGILFRNLRPEGTPDDATLHAGCPVIEGEKWLATLWIRERAVSYR